jgi:hypothetical protein
MASTTHLWQNLRAKSRGNKDVVTVGDGLETGGFSPLGERLPTTSSWDLRARLVTKFNATSERLMELDVELDLLDEQRRLDLRSAA